MKFLTKLVALRPGKTVRDMIKNVMEGRDEGADASESKTDSAEVKISGGIAGRVSYLYFRLSKSYLLQIC